MIRLDAVSFEVREHAGRRAVLDRASFTFGPGIHHVASEPAGDARHLVQLLAGYRAPSGGRIACRGPRSWPLAQFAPFGVYLTGLDIIDTLCALYALERRGTFGLFRALMPEAEWLERRFDRWPQPVQRQFGHVALLAPVFESYLLDVSPVLPDADFYRRWADLFRRRIAGRSVVIASGHHRAAWRDFPGTRLILTQGGLHPAEGEASGAHPALAAE
jgi:hypothetical protein